MDMVHSHPDGCVCDDCNAYKLRYVAAPYPVPLTNTPRAGESAAATEARTAAARAAYKGDATGGRVERPLPPNKPTNPKDMQGIKKAPSSCVSAPVMQEVAVGMLEGALKYGRHNYRVIGVRGSIYYDATKRHLDSWWEGEDFDPDSKVGLHHISKAIASLVVLRDAMIQNKFVDDRPPKSPPGWEADINRQVEALLKAYPDPVPPYLETTHPARLPPWKTE